jgi:L-ascorbate metabolism protein UlaG (beta-lactamase superfamily)
VRSALPTPARRHPVLRAFSLLALLLLGLIAIGIADAWQAVGTLPRNERLQRISQSAQYRGGKFVDTLPRQEPNTVAAGKRWLRGVPHSQPDAPLPVLARQTSDFEAPPVSELRITWFGHSSLLVEIEGKRILVDPVWGDRCSPSSVVGPTRFHAVALPIDALPALDAVVISHDHYDHLDYPSILALKERPLLRFIVPLGVGAHLEYWGISPARITELDWWQSTELDGLRLVATPARHFSGRGLGADRTLWSGWVLLGQRRRVYYSGDTAMFEGFAQIGERLGPFDATLIEVGAYDAMWADVHLGPEQAVQAHRSVRGGVLLPVHWGTFDLALHSWVEPAERVLAAAALEAVVVVTPRPGESIDPLAPTAPVRWWPHIPWKTAAETPVISSGLAGVLPGARQAPLSPPP